MRSVLQTPLQASKPPSCQQRLGKSEDGCDEETGSDGTVHHEGQRDLHVPNEKLDFDATDILEAKNGHRQTHDEPSNKIG